MATSYKIRSNALPGYHPLRTSVSDSTVYDLTDILETNAENTTVYNSQSLPAGRLYSGRTDLSKIIRSDWDSAGNYFWLKDFSLPNGFKIEGEGVEANKLGMFKGTVGTDLVSHKFSGVSADYPGHKIKYIILYNRSYDELRVYQIDITGAQTQVLTVAKPTFLVEICIGASGGGGGGQYNKMIGSKCGGGGGGGAYLAGVLNLFKLESYALVVEFDGYIGGGGKSGTAWSGDDQKGESGTKGGGVTIYHGEDNSKSIRLEGGNPGSCGTSATGGGGGSGGSFTSADIKGLTVLHYAKGGSGGAGTDTTNTAAAGDGESTTYTYQVSKSSSARTVGGTGGLKSGGGGGGGAGIYNGGSTTLDGWGNVYKTGSYGGGGAGGEDSGGPDEDGGDGGYPLLELFVGTRP